MAAVERHSLWLPGVGTVPLDIRAVARTVEEYDDRYTLGYDEMNHQYVVVAKRGPNDGPPFPVFGLGRTLPSVDEVKKKLYENDVARHGGKVIKDITARNEARKAAIRKDADEKAGPVAEAMESYMRKQGAHPSPRVFVPSNIPNKKES